MVSVALVGAVVVGAGLLTLKYSTAIANAGVEQLAALSRRFRRDGFKKTYILLNRSMSLVIVAIGVVVIIRGLIGS